MVNFPRRRYRLGAFPFLAILAPTRLRFRKGPPQRGARGWSGFTLVELLAVVAIVGVLAGILIPSVGAARAASQRAQTRLQFAAWTVGFEAYRQEYGQYPPLPGGAAAALINTGAGTTPAADHWFHDALAGRHRDGSALADSAPENPRRLRFLSFGENDFVSGSDVAVGENRNDELQLVRDAFANTAIAVVIDANLDGLINAGDLAELPAVVARHGTKALRPSGILTGPGVRAGVIFYSARPGAVDEDDLIMSWP